MFNVVYGRQRPEMELPMTHHRSFRLVFVFVLCLLGTPLQPCPRVTRAAESDTVRVTDFLPNGYVTDGSVCYQTAIQKAMDQAAARHQQLTFRPMIYRIDDPAGLRLHSGTTLSLHGAVFRVSASAKADGQVFLGQDVTDVTLLGGEIAGQRDSWPDSVNISAIRIRGRSGRIRVRDTYVHDMSSNAVGVFGTADQPITHVWVHGLLAQRCCNKYTDYLLPNQGPAKGSTRMDQGTIALYYVHNFVVDDCALEDSRSDGTHFYRCRDGRFVNSTVTGSTMGGYFVESSHTVLASGNVIQDNGSRGVTIEAGSTDCILANNLITGSGREGLWAPDSIRVVVTGNIFRHNGRKDDADKDGEIMINESTWDPPKTPRAENYRVVNNLFETTAKQGAAIRLQPKVADIIIENNTFRGAVRQVIVQDNDPDVAHVVVKNNDGVEENRQSAHRTVRPHAGIPAAEKTNNVP